MTDEAIRSKWQERVREAIQKKEEEEWRVEMIGKEKLRNYRKIKDTLTLETYLTEETNKKGRYLLTNLRTGTNRLRIELGRRVRPVEPVQDRLCMSCMNGEVEDEKHFLINCQVYQDLREDMYIEIGNVSQGKWKLKDKEGEEVWKLLLGGTKDSFQTQIFEKVKKLVKEADARRCKR